MEIPTNNEADNIDKSIKIDNLEVKYAKEQELVHNEKIT